MLGWGPAFNAFLSSCSFTDFIIVQSTDQFANCDQIIAEIKANNERMSDLASEEGLKVGQNVAAGVVGLLIWPVWFGMDFQDAAGKEGRSLSQRNEYLGTLARDRCGVRTENIPYRDERAARTRGAP